MCLFTAYTYLYVYVCALVLSPNLPIRSLGNDLPRDCLHCEIKIDIVVIVAQRSPFTHISIGQKWLCCWLVTCTTSYMLNPYHSLEN